MTDVATPPLTTPAPEPVAVSSAWGDPLALGLASFGISALVLAAVNSGWVAATATPGVLCLALALGFFTELVAGVICFTRGETFAGTVFVAYAGFWLSYALLVWIFLPQVVAAGGPVSQLVGWFLLAWSIFTTYMLLAAVRTTTTILAIFALLTLTFWLLTIGTFAGSTALSHTSGYVLLVDAALALFLSAAAIVNDTWGRIVIPAP
jgi:succinate-acetate transporter protein